MFEHCRKKKGCPARKNTNGLRVATHTQRTIIKRYNFRTFSVIKRYDSKTMKLLTSRKLKTFILLKPYKVKSFYTHHTVRIYKTFSSTDGRSLDL